MHSVLFLSLFLSLLLPQRKFSLLCGLTLRLVDFFAFGLSCLALRGKRLLRFCADPGRLKLLRYAVLPSFRMIRAPPFLYFDRRTELQLAKIAQNICPYLIILWLRAKGHFANRKRAVLDFLKYAHLKRIFKIYRQRAAGLPHVTSSRLPNAAPAGQHEGFPFSAQYRRQRSIRFAPSLASPIILPLSPAVPRRNGTAESRSRTGPPMQCLPHY